MNKKDEFKIELISNIDEQIIEKQTLKRFRLMLKNRVSRKKIAGWCGAAACFLISFSVLFAIIFPLSFKHVPVYEGMTVSKSMPSSQMAAGLPDESPLYVPLAVTGTSDAVSNLAFYSPKETQGMPASSALLNETSEITEETQQSFLDIEGVDRSLYYAKKNEDIYITVHINNPASFEILSFTLNGTKYQSYMFAEGSNSEELILKVNVGEAQGIVEYTIDAIKYVDGTEIKDVRMNGERTVQIGVYPEDPKDHPMVAITDTVIGCDEIAFTTTLSDVNDMVQASKGTLYAFLYVGEDQVAQKELSVSENTSVVFSDLIHGTGYRYNIVAYYDSLDGSGFGAYCLCEEYFYTKSFVEITDINLVDGTDLFFDINITGGQNVSVQKIELFKKSGTVESTGNGDIRSFSGLAIGSYTLKVTYSYDNGETRIGYAYSATDVVVDKFGGITNIVKDGKIVKDYYDVQKFNPSTGDYRAHLGIDVLTTDQNNKDVYAAFTGIVKEVSRGRVVLTDRSGTVELTYESLENIPDSIKAGSEVIKGEKIGVVGCSYKNEAANPEHVHIELRVLGEYKNPMLYFKD